MERATGIEPAFSAWEADVLPLNYARVVTMVLLTSPTAIDQSRGVDGLR